MEELEKDTKNSKENSEYAKYILRGLHAILNQSNVAKDGYKKTVAENYDKFKGRDYNYFWGLLYDAPYREVAMVVVSLVDLEDELEQIFDNAKPQTEFIEHFVENLSIYEQLVDEEEFTGSEEEISAMKLLSACYQVLNANFISKITYGVGIQALLLAALKEDNTQAFINAVMIDRAVLGSRLANQVVCNAIFRDDKSFFDGLGRAIKGSYPVRTITPEDEDLRALFVIEEDLIFREEIKGFTQKEAYDFYAVDRQLYGEDGADPFGSFNKVRQRFRERFRKVKDSYR